MTRIPSPPAASAAASLRAHTSTSTPHEAASRASPQAIAPVPRIPSRSLVDSPVNRSCTVAPGALPRRCVEQTPHTRHSSKETRMQNGSGREVVIVEAVRTPIGRGHPEKGYYKDTHPNELLGKCYTEVIERAGIPAEEVEDVITGCVQQYGEQMFNVGRNAWLQPGLPIETPATTVDRQCGSAQQAVNFSAALIASGVHDAVIG